MHIGSLSPPVYHLYVYGGTPPFAVDTIVNDWPEGSEYAPCGVIETDNVGTLLVTVTGTMFEYPPSLLPEVTLSLTLTQ